MGRQGSRALGFGLERLTATIPDMAEPAEVPDNTAVRTALSARPARGGRRRAARARGRGRPASRGARRRLARAARHGPGRHQRLPGLDRRPGPLRRRPRRPSRPPPASASTSSSAPVSTRSPQRRPDLGARLQVFEVDQPGTQAWKQRRLVELGLDIPGWLHLVPVDFESGASWWDGLLGAGFDPRGRRSSSSTGVSMYLSKDTTAATLRQLATLAPGSTVAMTFLLPIELVDAPDQAGLETSTRGARSSGTPFVSFFTPEEILAMAREAGFVDARHVPGSVLAERYFADRPDALRPSSGEDFLIAAT